MKKQTLARLILIKFIILSYYSQKLIHQVNINIQQTIISNYSLMIQPQNQQKQKKQQNQQNNQNSDDQMNDEQGKLSLKSKKRPFKQIKFYCKTKQYIIIWIFIGFLFFIVFAEYFNSLIFKKTSYKLYAGQLHYSRIPFEYWDHRIKMSKAMGLNALSVYVMWNHHQISKGKFDYENGNKNLSYFLQLAKQNNMTVLIRPGPYICAQWDMGGMPARLYSIPGIKIRSYNKQFLDQVEIYFKQLYKIIFPYFQKNGGSIAMLQIENEYGFFGTDKRYIISLREIWKSLNLSIPIYYVDWIENLHKSHWDRSIVGINNFKYNWYYKYFRLIERSGFIFGGEIYTGWMSYWGGIWDTQEYEEVKNNYNFLVKNNYSFSMYMAHGGTNFGLTAGGRSVYQKEFDYQPIITSYDYDAPINQQGSQTPKFKLLKEIMSVGVQWQVPQIPQPIPMIEIPQFTPIVFGTLLRNLKPKLINSKLVSFESIELQMWNQGIVVYETNLPQGIYQLKLIIRDFGLLFINQKHVTNFDRSIKKIHKLTVHCKQKLSNKISIVVEAMGHIHWDHLIQQDYKGLIQFQAYHQSSHVNDIKWNISTFLLNTTINQQQMTLISKGSFPTFSKAVFKTDKLGDTYLNMQKFGKGYVWVNGNNLGRFWNRGPQQKLYCPGVWLKKENEIIVLDLIQGETFGIRGQLKLI